MQPDATANRSHSVLDSGETDTTADIGPAIAREGADMDAVQHRDTAQGLEAARQWDFASPHSSALDEPPPTDDESAWAPAWRLMVIAGFLLAVYFVFTR